MSRERFSYSLQQIETKKKKEKKEKGFLTLSLLSFLWDPTGK